VIIATAASIAAIGLLLWLLFTLAIYALPFYVGLSAAFWSYQHDAGLIGAALVGILAAGFAFGIGQVLFATLRSPWARALVAAFYAAPAGVAGYFTVYGLSGIGGTGEVWRILLSVTGAVLIAGTAWVRVSALHPSQPGEGVSRAVYPSRGTVSAANDS
jgi:hypothetical protein